MPQRLLYRLDRYVDAVRGSTPRSGHLVLHAASSGVDRTFTLTRHGAGFSSTDASGALYAAVHDEMMNLPFARFPGENFLGLVCVYDGRERSATLLPVRGNVAQDLFAALRDGTSTSLDTAFGSVPLDVFTAQRDDIVKPLRTVCQDAARTLPVPDGTTVEQTWSLTPRPLPARLLSRLKAALRPRPRPSVDAD